MYRNSLQTGIISVMYSVGANPLAKWEKKTRNGHISRIADEDLRCLVIELSGSNVATTYIALPSDNTLLGIRLPFLVMIVKNLRKYFTFEVQILDDKDVKRRFRVSSYQTTTKVHSYACTMPIILQPGWNQVQFDLEKFTRKAFGTGFVEAARLQVHANCRVRRIYFADKLYSENELPQEFRMYLPTRRTEILIQLLIGIVILETITQRSNVCHVGEYAVLQNYLRKTMLSSLWNLLEIEDKSKSLFGVGQGYDIDHSENNIEYYPEVTSTLDNETTENDEAKRQKQVEELKETIYDHIRNIRDPEKPATLEDLNVVYEDGVMIKQSTADGVNSVRIEFNPTVPHCSLATLIGLCIRVKLERNLEVKIKLDIYIKKGTHSTEEEINKQINDKERIAAAMENPDLRELVEGCIQEGD